MQFQVPQFIEVEDRIFGPLTFRQFLYLAGGAGLCFIVYVILPSIFLSIIPIIAIATLAGLLAFFKYNGRDFIHTVEAFVKYSLAKKLYLWHKDEPTKKLPKIIEKTEATGNKINVPRLSESKLHELSWSLDVRQDNDQSQN